jgi:hypothetical protein
MPSIEVTARRSELGSDYPNMPRHKNRRVSSANDSNSSVECVLESIATILLRNGLDSPRSEELLRRAFVNAAAKRSRRTGGKNTQSQIALLAGVSRLEVRKVLMASERSHGETPSQSRIDRILHAWRHDAEFSNSRGRARDLTFVGARSQFQKLVRKYGADITVRTFRDELITKKIVVVRGNRLGLRDFRIPNKLVNQPAQADLNFLGEQLSRFDFQSGKRSFSSSCLSLTVDDSKTLKLIQRETAARAETFLKSLKSLSHVQPKQAGFGRRRRAYRFIVAFSTSTETSEDSR